MKITITSIILLFGFMSYAQVPTNGLIAHYPFNGDLTDQSGNNFDATNFGASLTTDRNGNIDAAYSFDGVNDHLEIPYNTDLHLDFPFTVSLWFEIDAIPSNGVNIYGSDEVNNAYSGFTIGYIPTGKITVGYGNGQGNGGGNRFTKESNTVITTGTWYNVIAVFNGLNDIDLYINCQLDAGSVSGSANSMNLGTSNSLIGKSVSSTVDAYHHGKIDDIRLYNFAVSALDINALCTEIPSLAYIDDLVIHENIIIYPNPASGFINVELDEINFKDHSIEVYDLFGRILVKQEIFSAKTVLTLSSSVERRICFLKIFDAQGRLLKTEKLVVSR